MLDKDKIKDSLTKEDIEEVLTQLGSEPPRKSSQGHMIFNTVCHNSVGGSYKLYYYEDTQMFHCYTGCGDSFDIYDLTIRAKRAKHQKFEFPDAIRFVANATGKYYSMKKLRRDEDDHIIDDWEWINRYSKRNERKNEVPELAVYDETVLEVFKYVPHELWLNEGITWETMIKYRISYHIPEDKIVIPHFNIDGNLIGIRGRALLEEDVENGIKYMPLKISGKWYNHQTSLSLYGLYENQRAIKKHRKAMLFEGEKSVLKCDSYYGEDNFTVATCGSTITTFQRDILISMGITEVFIAYDKQFEDPKSEEARNYTKKILKLGKKFAKYCRVYILWDTNDYLEYSDSPADKGQEILEKLMQEKLEVFTTSKPIEETI